MYRLVHHPLCPFSRTVRLVLGEKRIDADLREEPFWDHRAEFLRLNPAGMVPVLVIEPEGPARPRPLKLADSAAICEYVDETHPEPPLMPRTAEERAEVRRLMAWFNEKFAREVSMPLLEERLFKKIMSAGHPDSRRVQNALRRRRLHMAYMEKLLERRRWLAAERLTLADFAAAAHLSCLDYLGLVDWKASETVKTWYATMKSRPPFRSLLADTIPGFVPPSHYTDFDF